MVITENAQRLIFKKYGGFSEERLEEMKHAFEIFKKGALQRKNLIRTGESNPKEFMAWIHQQDSVIVELTSNY
ncbi:MAG: hypothetical protein K2N87_04505 [Eubacterium sp.]|nr:hypothetical protein [Eubacterium sp.]